MTVVVLALVALALVLSGPWLVRAFTAVRYRDRVIDSLIVPARRIHDTHDERLQVEADRRRAEAEAALIEARKIRTREGRRIRLVG